MELFKTAGTEYTPTIEFNPQSGQFTVSGVSRPENANEFYEPVIAWLKDYIQSPASLTEINFRFNYFNTSSLKYFLIILSLVKDLEDSGKKLVVNWYYDDEDDSMLEAGTSLEELSELTFTYHTNL